METDEELSIVFIGSALNTGIISRFLEDNGVDTLIKDNVYESVNTGRIWPDSDETSRLLVRNSDFEKAKNLIVEYWANIPQNKTEGTDKAQ
jgi:hypothetical protein